ncbi:radical SAM family heme chaperone HemW [candidate division CSSED10-310 bacterium]|uniref:Heme chaperone HemW n=1 Tax=candidate division CSSED10-310 bacterium TaxID=2855610 RepID=A0ABV6Z4D2_UNCC1
MSLPTAHLEEKSPLKDTTVMPGLYVHIPFCRAKCPYCDFYSVHDSELYAAWLKAIEQEIVLYKDRFSHFGTLYLGGGTPTVLPLDHLSRLIDSLFRELTLAPWAEKTIEANPDDITPEKLILLQNSGFNRISLGIQSFNDRILQLLARQHTAVASRQAVVAVREAGFENVNLDLMYGIPTQSLNDWIQTLEEAGSMEPEHISCYQLTFKDDTPFWAEKERGALQTLTEAAEEEFFLATSELLQSKGYIHYEISNYARQEKYYSAHNMNYWKRVPYLGLGPSSHSLNHETRWWNYRSVEYYIQSLQQGRPPVAGREILSPEQVRLEALLLNFRTRNGMDLKTLQKYHHANRNLPHLIESKLLEIIGDHVRPTPRGFLVADSLAQHFC